MGEIKGHILSERFMKRLPLFLIIGILIVFSIKRNGVYIDELSLWSDVVKKAPGNARGWHALAGAYIQRGMFDKAEECIRRSLRIQPEPITFVLLGRLEALRHRYENALLLYEEAIRRSEEEVFKKMAIVSKAKAYFEIGNIYFEVYSDPKRAEYYYRKAIELRPDDGKLWCNLGYSLIKQDRCKEALEVLEQAIRLMPEDRLTMENLQLARDCAR